MWCCFASFFFWGVVGAWSVVVTYHALCLCVRRDAQMHALLGYEDFNFLPTTFPGTKSYTFSRE